MSEQKRRGPMGHGHGMAAGEKAKDFKGSMKKLFKYMEHYKFRLCAQLRVCNQVGGNPIYPRSSQPDNSESWDVVGNSN